MKKELEQLLRIICNFQEVIIDDVKAQNRNGDVLLARHMFHYFARVRFRATFHQIAKVTNKDHATAINSQKKIAQYRSVGKSGSPSNPHEFNAISKMEAYLDDFYCVPRTREEVRKKLEAQKEKIEKQLEGIETGALNSFNAVEKWESFDPMPLETFHSLAMRAFYDLWYERAKNGKLQIRKFDFLNLMTRSKSQTVKQFMDVERRKEK